VLAATILIAAATGASAQSDASADALGRWVAAVHSHVPGQADKAAAFVAALTYRDREQLNPAMQLFFRLLRGERPTPRDGAARRVRDMFESMHADPGQVPFIRRAAVLHADAAIFAGRFPPAPDDAPPAPAVRGGRRVDSPPPLLSNERYVQQADGRVVGEVPANWNWPFARSLVDLLGGDRGFAGEWYHAVDSYMTAASELGALRTQLGRAAQWLPDDPRILFDRACYAETLGLAYNQTVRDDPNYWNPSIGISGAVPPEGVTDGEAERLYARAVQIDDGFAEARIRLARLLQRRGRNDEAIAEVGRALSTHPPPAIAFIAEVVAGRSELARGRARDALARYRAALVLFPAAQSALLGASHAAVMAADNAAAQAFVSQLGDRSGDFDADPWWSYRFCAGRDVEALMAALWARVKGS
jgi:tetratricopeptide (TPR) repeat protein